MTNAISYTSHASTVASALLDAKKHDDKANACREEANVLIADLHKNKVEVGRNGKCSIATAFYDTLVQGGLAKGTASNYLSVFKDAVKTGKPVTDWNPNRKGTAKVSGKAPKQERENPALDALFKFLKTEGALDIMQSIQFAYDDAEGDLTQIALEMLIAEGYEVE